MLSKDVIVLDKLRSVCSPLGHKLCMAAGRGYFGPRTMWLVRS